MRCYRTSCAQQNVEVIRGVQPVEIHGEESVDGLTVQEIATGSTRRLDVRGVFVEVGLYPNAEFALDLLETNERGEILVDSHSRTGVKGVYAAGDVTDVHDKQITIALGTGAKAALAAAEYLAALV